MTPIDFEDFCVAVQSDDGLNESIIDKNTGTIHFITDEVELWINVKADDCPEWIKETVEAAREYQKNPNNFITVPSQQEVDEYSMMGNFALTLNNNEHKKILLTAIEGRGAFRRFKNSVIKLGIEEAWYNYKDQCYLAFAKEWAEENNCKLIGHSNT